MSPGPAATPTTAAAGAATAVAAQPQAVAIVDATRLVLAQARQVLLDAVVQGRSGDGVVTLQTPQGNVQIRSTAPLPAGTQLALELTRQGEQLNARILPPAPGRGAPPPPMPTSGAGTGSAGSPPTSTPSPATAARGTEGAAPSPRTVEFGRATFPAIALSPSAQPQPGTSPVGTNASVAQRAPDASTSPNGAPSARAPGSGSAPMSASAAAAPATDMPRAASTPAPATTATTSNVAPSGTTSSPPAPGTAGSPTRPNAAAPEARSAAGPTSPGTPPLATPDPTIATRAASVYAQARATAPARDPRAPTTTGTPLASAARPSDAAPSPSANRPTSALPNGMPGTDMPAATRAASSQRLAPGTTFEVRLARAETPAATSGAPRQAQPLPATVVGALPQGRLMVDTPIGRLAIAVPPNLLATPPGGSLDLEWLPETSRAPLATPKAQADAQSTRAWPQTRDLAAALLARTDPAAREAADHLVPKPGPRLAQQMMGFIGRGDGDVARWLGDAMMRQLEQLGLADVLTRGEGAGAREPDRQPANGDWRHVTMPLFDGQNLHPVEFRARRRQGGGEKDSARDQSRFVVDCVHDELGAVQIDGLMTSGGAKKRLDIILRSHAALPEEDRVAIATLFADTCGAMGFGGEIAFQVADQFPVVADNPLAHRAVIA